MQHQEARKEGRRQKRSCGAVIFNRELRPEKWRSPNPNEGRENADWPLNSVSREKHFSGIASSMQIYTALASNSPIGRRTTSRMDDFCPLPSVEFLFPSCKLGLISSGSRQSENSFALDKIVPMHGRKNAPDVSPARAKIKHVITTR